MIKSEVVKILTVIKGFYPNANNNVSPFDSEIILISWSDSLHDYDYKTIYPALLHFVNNDEKGFPPVPGQLIKIVKATNPDPDKISSVEAWSMVKRAMRNSINNAYGEFNKLPRNIRLAVGSANELKNWAMEESSTAQSVAKSNFAKEYKELEEESHNRLLMDPGQNMIEGE